jgi:peptidyl-prolyl cis-trans isomerase B (cyclophilin B)
MAQKQWSSPPPLTLDVQRAYQVLIETEKGAIKLELYAQHAPQTVNNFIFLTREGFYDGVTFHRVIADFVIQGGDPTGTGRGGPGYKFPDEIQGNPLKHETGSLSMANAGPGTNGSQFFITHSPQPHLDGKHTVFGKVVAGQDVVAAIRPGDKMLRVRIEG